MVDNQVLIPALAAVFLATTAPAALAGGVVETPPEVVVMPDPEPMGNWYGALSLGYATPTTLEGVGEGFSFPEQGIELSLEASQLLSAALGYEMSSGLRLEVEAIYMHGNTDELTVSPPQITPISAAYPGDYTVTAGMANAWYSFGTGAVRPFIGGGIGMARIGVDIADPSFPGIDGIDDSTTATAWQIGVGADVAMSDNMSLVMSYRVLNIDNIELTDEIDNSLSVDYQNHIVTAGVRFSF